MSEIVYVTKEGLESLKQELEQLMTVERPSISQQIAEARDKGDLSENAEYDAAKEAQGMLEMKIAQVQDKVRNARIIDESQLGTDIITIMNKVKLKNLKTKKVLEYTLVPINETNVREGKISVKTPIAKGLLGKKVGDTTKIKIPTGEIEFQVMEIGF